MPSGELNASRVRTVHNPYVGRVHGHPAYLLPRPGAQDLAQRLAASGCQQRLWVDLGSGSGAFLLGCAQGQPQVGCVGFELRYKRLVRSAEKAGRLGLRNVWFLRERAQCFAQYFAPQTLERIHVLFPDPWPKPRDWKKRLLGPPLLNAAARTLKPEGLLCVKTDYSGQFLHFLEAITHQSALRVVFFSNDASSQPTPIGPQQSEFEQLFRQQRLPLYCVVLQKQPPP